MVSAESKEIILAILPKVTGFMSMIGSGLIIYSVLFNAKRRKKIYHRIMCGLSISDFLSSFMIFLSTWPIPKEKEGVYGNVGNQASCEAIGMLAQTFAIGTPFYNLSLCFYYFMVIWRGMPERKIMKYERWLHILPITVAFGTGIAGIPLTLYNPAGFLCWIAADPPGCDRDPTVSCNRGSLSWLFRWVFFYGWIWAIFLVITAIMFMLYRKVQIQEKASNKHRMRGQAKCRKRSRKVANQAMQYVCSYYITFLFGTLTRFLQLAQAKTYFPIVVLFAIFYPLQGTFNAIIYFYSKKTRDGWTLSSSVSSMAGASLRSIKNSFARKNGQERDDDDIIMKGSSPNNKRDPISNRPSQKATSATATSEVLNSSSQQVTISAVDLEENESSSQVVVRFAQGDELVEEEKEEEEEPFSMAFDQNDREDR